MSREEEKLRNILRWFEKAGFSAVMADLPEKIGQSSGVSKGKETTEEIL